jgi:hypothetical protein
MKKRKIRDEADARSCMAAAARSGLAATRWAHSAGIDGRSLRAWTMNLQRRAGSKRADVAKAVQLVELVPSASAPAASRYVVRVGSHSVEVDDHFDAATLRRLVAVLSTC